MNAPHPLLQRPCWIFDLDGTLTRPIHDFAAIRAELGISPGEGILEFIDAQPIVEREALQARLIEIERALAHRAEPNPGAVPFLQLLHRRGCRLAIFTRNRHDCVQITLERLGVEALFDPAAIMACDNGPPKPDPSAINALIGLWGVTPTQCLIVGDYLYDLQAGRQAGIGTLHYQSDGEPDRVWPALTDLRVGSFEEVHEQVERLTSPVKP